MIDASDIIIGAVWLGTSLWIARNYSLKASIAAQAVALSAPLLVGIPVVRKVDTSYVEEGEPMTDEDRARAKEVPDTDDDRPACTPELRKSGKLCVIMNGRPVTVRTAAVCKGGRR